MLLQRWPWIDAQLCNMCLESPQRRPGIAAKNFRGHAAELAAPKESHTDDQGSMTVTPQLSKSDTFGVANAAPDERVIAAT